MRMCMNRPEYDINRPRCLTSWPEGQGLAAGLQLRFQDEYFLTLKCEAKLTDLRCRNAGGEEVGFVVFLFDLLKCILCRLFQFFSVLSSQTLNSMIKASSIRLKYSLFQEINQLHLYGAHPLAGHDIYPTI